MIRLTLPLEDQYKSKHRHAQLFFLLFFCFAFFVFVYMYVFLCIRMCLGMRVLEETRRRHLIPLELKLHSPV